MGDLDLAEQINRRLRRDVIRQHALVRNGNVVFCSPTHAETIGAKPRTAHEHQDGKVIYPTVEAAIAASAELARLGSKPQRAYPCTRADHYHLSTEFPRAHRKR